MAWDRFIKRRAVDTVFRAAWRRGQHIRLRAERISRQFFRELVTVGIDVPGAPRLGRFTPHWEPLSNSWLDRKDNDLFYFDTGALERSLLRKSTDGVFGRPAVTLRFEGRTIRVTASPPPKKYAGASGPFTLILTPFPRIAALTHVEDVVATPGSKTFFKLINPKGNYLRPLVSPFMQWYIHVKMKAALR